MKNKSFSNYLLILSIVFLPPLTFAQSMQNTADIDAEFMESLPDSVRDDVLKEMEGSKKDKTSNYIKRPSSKLSKLDIVKDWEDFKKKQSIDNMSERYGIKLFNTMQSSFMPLNEPNFGNNYIIDYGDVIGIQLFGGGSKNSNYEIEVQRDGTLLLEDIGAVSIAGLNFEQAADFIKNKYEASFVGFNVVVTLSEIRDINILITGNVEFPGMYTLSGNSNVLQALNIAGGINENGSLRNITIKRKNKANVSIDLYEALIFGNIDNIPFLMSGDSIHIEPVKNLVRAGYGFNNIAIFEMKVGETLENLIRFSGGLKIEANKKSLNLVRLENNSFNSSEIPLTNKAEFEVNNLDSIYAYKEKFGTVTISGDIKHPGKYFISSSDRISDLINRSGGYTDSAYVFGASLFREDVRKLEQYFADKAYKNLITFLISNPGIGSSGSGNEGIAYLLTQLKEFKSVGRVVAEFDQNNLKNNIQDNIFLSDGDEIHVPSYTSNIYVFGEVGNPGSVLFKENTSLNEYINMTGGLGRYASSGFIFIVSPNGETKKVSVTGLSRFINQDFDIYPGSVVFVPRQAGKVAGIDFYATIAPIFSSVALSIASLNSITN